MEIRKGGCQRLVNLVSLYMASEVGVVGIPVQRALYEQSFKVRRIAYTFHYTMLPTPIWADN